MTGLAGSHQRINAAIALSLCREWVAQFNARSAGSSPPGPTILLPEASELEGLREARWPGMYISFLLSFLFSFSYSGLVS
jgi:hypothetical protein